MKLLTLALFLPALWAGSIDFERSSPCSFLDTQPLGSEYAPIGVVFYGPSAGSGGATINQCGFFGINARSGTDFLAFATDGSFIGGGQAIPLEYIEFASPVANVALYVGGTSYTPAYEIRAYDSVDGFLGAAVGKPAVNTWLQLTLNYSNISRVTLSHTSVSAVVDDLTWNNVVAIDEPRNEVPEPSALVLSAAALAALALLRTSPGAWLRGKS